MEFTRTIESFAPTTPVIAAEFDASLKGAGLIWFAREGGTEVALGVCAVDLSFLEFGDDSSYQNLAEFTGAIIAVAGQIILGLSGSGLALRGDSIMANTWAFTEMFRCVFDFRLILSSTECDGALLPSRSPRSRYILM